MKTKSVFKSFLPLLVFVVVQLVVATVASTICSAMFAASNPELVTDIEALTAGATELYLSNVITVITVVHLINVLIMILWIRKYNRLVPDVAAKTVLTAKNIIMLIIAGLGVQCFVVAILTGVTMVDPNALDSYADMMQSSGVGQLTFFSFLATVILAPIGEELCFRGVTAKILRNAKLPVWAVIVVPSVLFGIAHLNLVQGTYAAFMGLALGYIAYKYKSVLMAIILHVIINLSGTLISELGIGFENEAYNLLAFGVCGIVLILIAYFFFDKKNEEVVLEVEEAPVFAAEEATQVETEA